MPFVKVTTSTGWINFHYNICTPLSENADRIDPSLPVVLFFHAMAIPSIFHSQFCDPALRSFNLVTFDLRWHGHTTSTRAKEPYGQENAAEDVKALIDVLQLPPCHFVAIDIGTLMAMQVAIENPKQVLSLTLISHVCLEELPDIQEGRAELFRTCSSLIPEVRVDTAIGYMQYAFSNKITFLGQATYDFMLPFALENWDDEHYLEHKIASFEIFVHRKAQTQEALSRLSCPVKLVYGTASLAYPPSYTKRLYLDLKAAGVQASMLEVPHAPHYLSLDHSDEINPVIYDFIVENSQGKTIRTPSRSNYISPWDGVLRACGWDPSRQNALDDDIFTVSWPPNPHMKMLQT
ncbi:Alpha/Beta hydrolase protein [Rhodocollybia butyracea]|uniref:Alpha/Beta hydrolase protein n=1 Tax=Rhodocollybia butyracea TaxID=206335 RepID=A0A9P5U352_9AGAR|nr:Alpha/Beta hydrolase protein [Rhodocollybia butyracea]